MSYCRTKGSSLENQPRCIITLITAYLTWLIKKETRGTVSIWRTNHFLQGGKLEDTTVTCLEDRTVRGKKAETDASRSLVDGFFTTESPGKPSNHQSCQLMVALEQPSRAELERVQESPSLQSPNFTQEKTKSLEKGRACPKSHSWLRSRLEPKSLFLFTDFAALFLFLAEI